MNFLVFFFFHYRIFSSFKHRGGKLLVFSLLCKLFHTSMFNYLHSFVLSLDKSVDDGSLKRMRDKYPCRVSDTFVYLAPCFTIVDQVILLQFCFIVLSKCWVNVVCIYIDYLYTALSFNIQTKEWLIHMGRSTFWKVFSFYLHSQI